MPLLAISNLIFIEKVLIAVNSGTLDPVICRAGNKTWVIEQYSLILTL